MRSANQWGLLVAIAYVEWRESVIAAKLIMVSVSNGNVYLNIHKIGVILSHKSNVTSLEQNKRMQ